MSDRARNAREELSKKFLNDLKADWTEHGTAALQQAREMDPLRYCQLVASTLPKEIELTRPFDGMSDEELESLIEHARAELQRTPRSAAEGTADPPRGKLH